MAQECECECGVFRAPSLIIGSIAHKSEEGSMCVGT